MPDRYCRNCGNELRETDRFCSNCAAPVHETAHVPTPGADVEVPSPPQQPQAGRTEKKSPRTLLLTLVVVVGLIWFLGSLGEDTGDSSAGDGGSGAGGNRQAAEPSDESGGASSGETFTNENYAEIYSDPAAHKGAQVNVTGQLLERPEVDGDELAFQMFADAENSEWNTVVYTDQTDLDLNTDDYVRVHGEVLGTFEGENAFGASLEAPMIQASKISTVGAGQAIDPAKKVINVGQTLGDQGFEITLKKIEFGEESPVVADDSLRSLGSERYDMVLTNPPFGKKSSYTVLGADGRAVSESQTYERDDFWATTSNKQLNFLQHVKSLLRIGGSAAVVVPDNVLFEGGAGETVRRRLLREYDVHTLLRLPTGIFYAQGVKANVLFFERKPASETPWTSKLWIYDLRTNQHFTLKQNTLNAQALRDFVTSYNAAVRSKREETERFRAFVYEELVSRDKANLDIFWLRDKSLEGSEDLQPPDVIAAEIAENLEAALEQFAEIHEDLRLSKTE